MIARIALATVSLSASLFASQVPTISEPIWKQMATFGIIGLILAWLLIERFLVGQKDREARHAQANAIHEQAMAMSAMTTKLEDLNRAMWNLIIFGVAKGKVPADATPPKSPRVDGGAQ